jgi:hypothetical protein
MVTSRFNNLRVGLATAIASQLTTDGTTGVTVTERQPLGDYSREDRIWMGNIRGNQQPLTMGASGSRLEDLEVDLFVYAPRNGRDSQASAEERAELIFASVENTCRNDITVGSTVFNVEVASFESTIDQIDEKGPIGWIEAVITAEAHL